MIGRWHGLIIDCPDPSRLASFYQDLMGMQRIQDEGDWVVIGDAPDRPGVAFQRVADFRPPQWPDPAHPQQMRVDVRVDSLDDGERGGPCAGRAPAARRRGAFPGLHRSGRPPVLPGLLVTGPP